jgi:hypothetical protein
MKKWTYNEKQLIEYLLGQLPPKEQTRIEEQYLADPEFHEVLRATERDLIDQYVRGELSNPKQFEEYFLTSDRRRRKVEFARALMQASTQDATLAIREESEPQRLSWGGSLALYLRSQRLWLPLAAGLVLLVGILLIVDWQKQNAPDPTARGPQPAQPPPTPVPQPGVPPPPQPAPPLRVAVFVLTPSLIRSVDETQTFTIERDTEVRLELQLEAVDYVNYRAVLRTPEGTEVWRQDGLKPQRTASGQVIILSLPATRLGDEDYTVRLSGVTAGGDPEDVSSYYFRAKKIVR